MTELSAGNAGAWLRARNIDAGAAVFTELGGGVSNRVILAESPGLRLIVKQSLGRLRVEREWLSNRSRIFREAQAMQWLCARLTGGRVPKVVLEVPEDFAIVMEAAPSRTTMWKTRLFEGRIDCATAVQAGQLLGSVIASSWNDPEAERLFGDQTVFEQLRIDPYYRFTAARHPQVARRIGDLTARSASRRVSMVHGDFSPKNLLTGGADLWAIDWEAVHFGDPSFDVAFLCNHLLLKAVAMPQHASALTGLAGAFTEALSAAVPPDGGWVMDAALEHLPALLLARVDGKSPAEYLDSSQRERARAIALSLFSDPPSCIDEAFAR